MVQLYTVEVLPPDSENFRRFLVVIIKYSLLGGC